jgi:hypothetical protein
MDIDYIADNASSQSVSKGLGYYYANLVAVQEFDGSAIAALVGGSNGKQYTTSAHFSGNNVRSVSACHCTCPAFAAYPGYCKHIVAVLLKAQSLDKSSTYIASGAEDPSRESENEKSFHEKARERAKRQSDYRASELLYDAAVLRLNRSIEPNAKNEFARLSVTFHYNYYDNAYLTYKIGFKKQFVVKDIGEIADGFMLCNEKQLGVKTKLRLDRKAFDEESRPLIDYLIECYNSLSGYGNGYERRKRQYLSPLWFDKFMDLYHQGNVIDVELDDNTQIRPFRVIESDFPAEFSLNQVSDGVQLGMESDVEFVFGLKKIYVFSDKKIYKCSEAYKTVCGRFLADCGSGGRPLFFSDDDLPALFSAVISDCEKYLRFSIQKEVETYRPAPLVAKVFFDLNEKGDITARMIFSYGENDHLAFEQKTLDVSLDYAGERCIEEILVEYMGRNMIGDGTLLLSRDNEEAIYELAKSGVDDISRVAEVYASEEFDSVKIRPPFKISIGVKVESGLLEIDIDPDNIDYAELWEIMESYHKNKKFRRLRDGSFLSLEDESISQIAAFTDGLDLTSKDFKTKSITMDLNRVPYVDAMLKESESVKYKRDESFRGVVRRFNDVADADYETPQSLEDVMRHYQETGYRWLRMIDALNFGGILADDMGLGKTLQVLALILAKKQTTKTKIRSIVVCPASLVLNWELEATRFTPELKVIPMIGSKDERERIIRKPGNYDLLVTSYQQMIRDIELYIGIEFEHIILDEAQFIKNQATQSAKSVKLLSGKTKLALTGTPVENSLAELWSIFDFVMPGYLRSYTHFRQKYENAIVKNGDMNATERLKTLVRPFMLRRLKSDVLKELPEKTEQVIMASLDEIQGKVYLAALAQAKKELAERLEEVGAAQSRIVVLAALTRMRQICCDPSLLYDNYEGGSAKLETCMELISSCIDSGHRILLFSQFTSMLSIIRDILDKDNIEYYYLDGSTPKGERMELVTRFNVDDTPIFLISLKAGGTGLNLTGADVVIHYDPWWNVSVQNQATDRAHRIGQIKNVQVFKLIAKDTIEEKIMELQEKKLDLADSIIREGGNALDTLTNDELLSLFDDR